MEGDANDHVGNVYKGITNRGNPNTPDNMI